MEDLEDFEIHHDKSRYLNLGIGLINYLQFTKRQYYCFD